MKTDTSCMSTLLYACKYIHSSQICFCFDQIHFIQFLSKMLNFEDLNAQAKIVKLWLA
jgi:hypothetical protein